MSTYSIETAALRRVFRLDRTARRAQKTELVALEDISLCVRPGELFGLLGPNGAGKTTAIRILCTLLSPTAGRAFIEGLDVEKELWRVRRIINSVSGGDSCGYGVLTSRENLRLFTELYGIPWKIARPRVEEMLKVVGLDQFEGVRTNKLSTGMRQRLNFARGFTTEPTVLFLDEPTVGLDVLSALEVRRFVKKWLAERPTSTILLTTHYMAEADEMCDRVAIIDKGRLQACDTPENLKHLVQKETALELTLAGSQPIPEEWKTLDGVVRISQSLDAVSQTTQIRALLATPDASGLLIKAVASDGRRLVDLKTVRPTLEDVFLKLTGRRLAQAEPESDGTGAPALKEVESESHPEDNKG